MPSLNIISLKNQIYQMANKYHADNLRVFGSFARGDNNESSGLDLWVKFLPGESLLG